MEMVRTGGVLKKRRSVRSHLLVDILTYRYSEKEYKTDYKARTVKNRLTSNFKEEDLKNNPDERRRSFGRA